MHISYIRTQRIREAPTSLASDAPSQEGVPLRGVAESVTADTGRTALTLAPGSAESVTLKHGHTQHDRVLIRMADINSKFLRRFSDPKRFSGFRYLNSI